VKEERHPNTPLRSVRLLHRAYAAAMYTPLASATSTWDMDTMSFLRVDPFVLIIADLIFA
jgi:hypothetical protein